MSEAVVRPARADEAGFLSALAVRSKGIWGYDEAFLAASAIELRVAPEDCDGIRVIVAEQDGVVIGFAQLAGEAPSGELTELFIDPTAIRKGIGRQLLGAAMDTARGIGMTELTIDSDPNAEPFYLQAGAIRCGWVPGLTPGRLLPRLLLRLGS